MTKKKDKIVCMPCEISAVYGVVSSAMLKNDDFKEKYKEKLDGNDHFERSAASSVKRYPAKSTDVSPAL